MSIRSSDISRWPLPPSSSPQAKVRMCLPYYTTWPVMPIHNTWLLECSERYNFDGDVNEVLRHLIYTANSEPTHIKKLIFKTVRCLHCHVGARADQHIKINLGTKETEVAVAVAEGDKEETSATSSSSTTRILIHTFHYEWLCRVTGSCNISSVEKCIRIILDYYQSRVKQVYHSDGQKAAFQKELELFGRNRDDDPRFMEVLQKQKALVGGDDNANTSDEEEEKEVVVSIINDDPAACSLDDMSEAIKRCQVGRNSASYSIAMKETLEETTARRAKEIVIEQSDEAKAARIKIRQALGTPMG